jgi:hypothetical protein
LYSFILINYIYPQICFQISPVQVQIRQAKVKSGFHAGKFQLSSVILDGQQLIQMSASLMRSVDKMDYTNKDFRRETFRKRMS